jgi:glycosyltransferase involved in cell wall biosynthesis
MKLYYVANARMPTEKAHGIQIAKMCEAFIETGIEVTLIAPHRTTDLRSLREYYGLRVDVPLVCLPALDWYTGGRIGYRIASLSFMFSYIFFLWNQKRKGEQFVLYTVDLDNYSSSALAFLGAPLYSEMHGGKPKTIAQRALFNNAQGIIAINKIIAKELKDKFPKSSTRYLVEPNGVDVSKFSQIEKHEARAQLGLPHGVPIVLYLGRFFEWKGLEILPAAAILTPSVHWQLVGGDEKDFTHIVKMVLPDNMFFAGSRLHSEVPVWFAAADALLVLGTVRDMQSYRYTSPMKLFEYLASGSPIIASNTPAIREIVSESEVSFYEPDDAENLARVLESVLTQGSGIALKNEAAQRLAKKSSWSARAARIVQFIEENTTVHTHV